MIETFLLNIIDNAAFFCRRIDLAQIKMAKTRVSAILSWSPAIRRKAATLAAVIHIKPHGEWRYAVAVLFYLLPIEVAFDLVHAEYIGLGQKLLVGSTVGDSASD
jgi:hypothetical protein